MECNSAHDCIEWVLRKENIFAPTDYYSAVERTRKPPYEIVRMDTEDFKNFQAMTKQLIHNQTKTARKIQSVGLK